MRRIITILIIITTIAVTALSAQNSPSMAVTSANRMATEAGIEILRSGGTAADAAFATAAVLTVVQPWFSSVMGGGTWGLYFNAANGEVRALDGVGPAASGATTEFFGKPANAASSGMHQAIVPGAWAGWMEWLKVYGRLHLDNLLQPAIEIAEAGYEIYPGMAVWLERGADNIAEWPYSREIYMPDGELLTTGDTVRQTRMAQTLRDVQNVYRRNVYRGRRAALDAANDYFYRGPIAESIVEYSKSHGGLFELSDFTGFRTELVDPISVDYRGITVYQNPPNSQGITMLIGLNILEGYDFSNYTVNSPDAVHLQIEALKLAHAGKHRHVGDPDYMRIPAAELLTDAYAASARKLIRRDRALTWPFPQLITEREISNTTTFSIIDRYGNGAAITTSLGAQFLVAGPSGVHINNRMRMFYHSGDLPNTVEPGKKVRHTSNPYLAIKDGRLYILGGNTGVDTQPQAQLQQFISVVEFGLTPQEAVSRPRILTRAFPAGQWPFRADNDLVLEGGLPASLREGLMRKGHTISEGGIIGNGQMILIDPDTGDFHLGTDPRGGMGRGIAE